MPEHRSVNKSIGAEVSVAAPTDKDIIAMAQCLDEAPLPELKEFKVAAMIESYEKSSGKMLTPGDLEKLKDFADTYPDGWFEKAVGQYPSKPLSYLEKILESWQKEGKASGKNRKHTRQLRPRNSYTESGNDDV